MRSLAAAKGFSVTPATKPTQPATLSTNLSTRLFPISGRRAATDGGHAGGKPPPTTRGRPVGGTGDHPPPVSGSPPPGPLYPARACGRGIRPGREGCFLQMEHRLPQSSGMVWGDEWRAGAWASGPDGGQREAGDRAVCGRRDRPETLRVLRPAAGKWMKYSRRRGGERRTR